MVKTRTGMQLNTINTDIQFLNLLAMATKCLYYTYNVYLKLMIASILAGIFLTSFFRAVPESPYSSDAASRSLLVASYSNCFSAAIVAPSQQWLQKVAVVQLHRFLCCGVKPII